MLASPPGRVYRSPEVSPQAQGGCSRHSRRTRLPLVDRGDGLVAFTSRFPDQTHADREGHHRGGGLHEPDRRSRLRRCAPSGADVRARTIAVCRDFGPEGPADAAADGPVERRAGDAGHRAADLRAHRKCDDAGGVDCQSWPPICAGLARQELHHGQHPRSTADPGGTARGRPRRAQPDRPSIQNPGRRIAGHG